MSGSNQPFQYEVLGGSEIRRRVGSGPLEVTHILDLLIRNTFYFDGRGSAPVRKDIGIINGRVARIADGISESALETVDASGLWAAPGFIDIHTHYDIEVELNPGLAESVRHGVTSVVMGNCSLSLTMGEPSALADIFLRVENIPGILVRKWMRKSVSWKSPQEYFEHLSGLKLGPNLAALLGHSALRAHVMGLERSLKEKATARDLEKMEDLVWEAFEAGCAGISVDMVPWHMMSGEFKGRTIPSQHADFREYRLLADLCRQRDLVFQVTPNPQRPWSMAQILWLSLGLFRPPLRVTILTALDSVAARPLRHFFPFVLFIFNRLLRCNIRFQTLTEPFTIYSDGPLTPLFEEFPSGVALNDAETKEDRKLLWSSPDFRARFKEEWLYGRHRTFHRRLELMRVVRCPNPAWTQKSFSEIAGELGREPIDAFIDLLERYDADLRWVSTGANDRLGPRLALMRHSHILPGFTDAGAHVRNLGYYDGALSLLKQAMATGFMSPQAAICRSTSEPARWFNLDTGVLEEGRQADIVLLDPQRLKDPISEQVEFADPLLDGALRMVKRGSADVVHSVYISGRRVFLKGQAGAGLGQVALGQVLRPAPSQGALKEVLRNRIDSHTVDHPFTRYWDIFVLKHQDWRNIVLHCLGVLVFYGLAFGASLTGNPWLLLGLPLSQLIGLLGHLLFEASFIDARDAVFSLRACWALNKMFIRVVTGRYGGDIDGLRQRLIRHRLRLRKSWEPGEK